MDAADLRSALTTLGWTQGDLSRRLGVHRNTANEWAQGKRAVPEYVSEYLRVMVLARRIVEGE